MGVMKKVAWCLLIGAFLFVDVGSVLAGERKGLDRALGVSWIDGRLVVVDGGGSDWSNEGSEVLFFDNGGKVEKVFSEGLVFAHSANKMANGNWLITNSGVDELVEINEAGEVVWSSEEWELSDGSNLDYPNDAEEVERGVFLVTDRNNDRVIKVSKNGEILWEYDDLYRPHNADLLESGNVMVSDSERDKVVEIDREGEIVWEYAGELNWPRDVDLLENGNYLIADSRNNRVVEITRDGELVWEYEEGLYWPYEVDELESGNIIVADSQNRRVVEVKKGKGVVREWDYELKRDLSSEFVNGGFEERGKFEAGVEREVEYKGQAVDVNRLVDGQVAEGWRPGVIIGEDEGRLSLDEGEVKGGERSGRIDYEGEGHVFWLQEFEAPKEGRWRLSGWVKMDSQERPGRGARLEVWVEGERGGFVVEPVVSEWAEDGKRWKRLRLELDVPEGGEVVQVRALFNDTGTAWFDGLVWEKVGWWKRWGMWFGWGIGAVMVVKVLSGMGGKGEE